MIKLEVEDYCHNECPMFVADVKTQIFPILRNIRHSVDTTIKCKNRQQCDAIKNFLEEEMKKNETS